MPDQTEIIPGLWMGGQTDDRLQTDFDAVVDCRQEGDVVVMPAPKQPHTVLLWCPMIDGPVLPDQWKINACIGFLDDSLVVPTEMHGNKVLVHCTAGINRSGLIVGTFLIQKNEMKSLDAIALIRQKRPGALSNQTFVDYLMSLKP